MKGRLAQGVLPGVLRDIYVGRRTGLLHLASGGERGSVLFIEGNIVHGSSTIKECRLGECLVRHGRISQADLDAATEAVILTRRRLGQVLLEMELLDQTGLDDALALHVREILLWVFAWRDGEYWFEEQDASGLKGLDRPLRLSTGEVILDAVWSVSDPDVVRYALGDLDRVPALASDPLLRFQRVTLTPTDGFLLSRIDGHASARQVLAMAPVGREEAERSLFGLLCTGMVELAPLEAAGPPAGEAHEVTAEEVLAEHRGLRARDHFAVLGLTQEAGEPEVRAAYLRLARRYHPDIHHRPELAHLRAEIQEIFDRLSTAYTALCDAQSRAEYESALLLTRLGAQPSPAEEVPAPPPPGPLDAEAEVRRLEELLRQAEQGFAGGRYWDAVQQAQEVVEAGPARLRQRGRVLLARCYLKNVKWRQLAEEELKAAIGEDPGNADAYFTLGVLYRDAGVPVRAAAMFRRALELKPRHAEARAALEAVGAPGGNERPGFLGRLLGKSPQG